MNSAGSANPTRQPKYSAQTRNDGRAEDRSDIDAHVENGETRIAPRAAFRVQRRHDRADVGLQQPDPHGVHQQAEEEDGLIADRQQDAAGGDEYPAADHRALCAEQTVGDPAAEESQQVGAAEEQAEDRARGPVIQAEAALGYRAPP